MKRMSDLAREQGVSISALSHWVRRNAIQVIGKHNGMYLSEEDVKKYEKRRRGRKITKKIDHAEVDETNFISIRKFAEQEKVHVGSIYHWIRRKNILTEIIKGKAFIEVRDTQKYKEFRREPYDHRKKMKENDK